MISLESENERQQRLWDLYDEVGLHVEVEIRRGGSVYHIVPKENREIKVRRTSRLLFTRRWPLCGNRSSMAEWPTEPDRQIHTLCRICARVAHRSVGLIQTTETQHE